MKDNSDMMANIGCKATTNQVNGLTKSLKHLLFAEGIYFVLSSVALYYLLTSTSDFNTKFFGILGFIAMLWVTIAWLVIARNSERNLESKK